MEILDIGTGELLLILLLAFILIGPGKMGETGRTIGKWLNKLFKSESWSTIRELSNAMIHLPTNLAREANLEELEREMQFDPELRNAPPRVISSPQRDTKADEAMENSIQPSRSQAYSPHQPSRPAEAKKPAAKSAAKKPAPSKSKKTVNTSKSNPSGKKRSHA